MPRSPTTADIFNATAEPCRRQIVGLLARRGSLAVGTLVETMGLPRPPVSKHLGVLRKVGMVAVQGAIPGRSSVAHPGLPTFPMTVGFESNTSL